MCQSEPTSGRNRNQSHPCKAEGYFSRLVLYAQEEQSESQPL